MKANIKGLVDRLELSPSKAMMSLYEAISNAIDAIEEHGDGFNNHSIIIRLVPLSDLAYKAGINTLVVDGFDVVDDGVGFNDKNLESFREAHTLSKVKAGGRGVGRFTFLKVFSSVHISSVFKRDDKILKRSFDFNINDELIGTETVIEVNETCGTTISLRNISQTYKAGWPNDPVIIAERIIGHFLIQFAAGSCPNMRLEIPSQETIDLQKLFQTTVLPYIQEQSFNSETHTFTLQAYRHPNASSRHELCFCANGRAVSIFRLRRLLPELPERFVNGSESPYALIVLITSAYFDEHTNQERTHITFQSDEELDLDPTLLSRSTLEQSIANILRPLLSDDLKSTNEEKRDQIQRFVEQQAPEYRVLTHPRYKEVIEQRIQPGLSEEKLDEALLHVKRTIEDDIRKEAKHVAALFETETFEQYQDKFKEIAEKANEIGKAQLASYIAHRRTILDLLNDSLKKKRTDDKYPLEKVLHKMVFPMGQTSKDIFFEQQNLWVIDERLCYHTLLTSDKKLSSIPGLEDTSGKEPDIFAFFYDTPIGVAEADSLPGGGIVIIEFKRPGRDDYDKDPADQIIQRFREISMGGVTDIDGRQINPVHLRYTGYLIADMTPSLRRQVFGRYHPTVDNEGYFSTLATGNGYIEIFSYNKLIQDAVRRNRILFDKLGLHKN